MAYIELKNVCKDYGDDDVKVKALKKINFEIEKGELVAIAGPSGAWKTKLLNILGWIDNLTSGEIIVDNKKINELKGRRLTKYRREDIGFVFQFYNLIQNLSVKENVELATQICKNKVDTNMVIKKVGLTKKKDNYPLELSEEEQQKVAIAMAVGKNSKILLCDEPTKLLDEKGSKQILKLLQNMAKKEHVTIIITTHNTLLCPIANKVLTLKNGSVSNVKINKKPKSVGDLLW